VVSKLVETLSSVAFAARIRVIARPYAASQAASERDERIRWRAIVLGPKVRVNAGGGAPGGSDNPPWHANNSPYKRTEARARKRIAQATKRIAGAAQGHARGLRMWAGLPIVWL